MARTIQCIQCGVVLNLPENAAGRKLKCPRCGTKFREGDGTAPGGSVNGTEGTGHSPDSTFVLTSRPSSGEMPVMPRAAGDLRETFDLPLMRGEAERSSGVSGGFSAAPSGSRQAADALALFDERPTAPRKKTGAEARAEIRRCPTCGGVIPVGMSICQTCGLDLETGMRVGLDDDLAPPPVTRGAGMPLPIAIIGGICAALSAILAIVALVQWRQGLAGAQYFIPIALFGVYAAVQFLRGKSIKLLLAALTLGAVIDLVAFVAMPVFRAQESQPIVVEVAEEVDDPDLAPERIRPVLDRLDTQRMQLGLGLLACYAVVCIYLLSPSVQRHFRK